MSKTKTSKRKNSHRVPVYRRPWIILLFFLAMAAAVIIALLFIKPRFVEPAPAANPTTTTNPDTTPAQEETISTTTTEPVVIEKEPEKTTQYEGEDPNTLEQLTGYLARKGVDDGILTIVAVIDQYLHTPGYCTIVLKNSVGQTVYSASNNAIPDVTASICDAFEIPTSSFASDTYQIIIELSSGNKRGIIADEVTL